MLLPELIELGKKNNIYNDKVETLAVKIENTETLLDVMNNIFDNGIYTRIAVDSEGLAEGGIIMNSIQMIIMNFCILLFPPDKACYIIKDECLGTFTRADTTFLDAFIDEKGKYNKLINEIKNNTNKYHSQYNIIKQYEDISMRKIGMVCGNIPNYMDKIHDMDMEEFTPNKVKELIIIYKEINEQLTNIITPQIPS
jgi:hypothetical protein